MKKYRCIVCGHVYDPAKGEPRLGVKPGTDFEELPQDWLCPECSSQKDQYEAL